MFKSILLSLICLSATSLFGQHEEETAQTPVTELEIQLQETFLEGNREKLLGNWDKAAVKFKDVLEKDPKNDAAAYELARVYEVLKNLPLALPLAKKAVELDPTNRWYQYYLADLYQKTDKDKDAAAIYEKLVKADPRNEEYYLKWAYYLVRASEPNDAIKVYDQLEKVTGVNEETARHKHTLYLGLGDYKKAAKELEALIVAVPDDMGYRHMLATFYQQVGEKEKARETYVQLLKVDPNDARAKIALAEEAKGSDDIGFLNSLKSVFEDPATDLDTKIKQLLPYVNKLAEGGDKNLGNTLIALTSLLETVHPNQAKTYSLLGDVLLHSGQPDKALEKYKKCLQLDETVWAVWEQVLYIYADKKDFSTLVKTAEQALDLFPNQALAHYFDGVGYNGLHQPNEALPSLQQALIMSSKNPPLRFHVLKETAEAYYQLKKFSPAENALGEAIKLNANDPSVLERMGDVQFQLGKEADAVKLWQKALELGGKSAFLERKVLEGKLVE